MLDENLTHDASASEATILVVDDNEANRSLVRHTLEDEGYRVVLATGGAAAITSFDAEPPDCVLLDVRMPSVDGFAVCEHIRASARAADVPVVFLTALRDVDTFDRAVRAGGDDFLTKPVQPAELLVRVKTALKVRRMGAELREHFELVKHQRDALLRLQLQKERLMAFVVHDLKNPLNTMDLLAQVLVHDRQLPQEARDAAAQIHAAASQLGRLLLNLLDVSKADEGKLVARRTRVDLRALVESLHRDFAVSADAHRVTLTSALALDRVRADEDLLRRVLANLIENAIRHAPAGGVVSVRAATVDGQAEIRVADTGPGVPAAMRERVFDPFLQLEGPPGSGSRGGRGLGLAFCRLAVECHGGRIWVEDAEPGAVFALRIPDDG